MMTTTMYNSSNGSNSNSKHGGVGVGDVQVEMNSYSLDRLLEQPQVLEQQKQTTIDSMKQLALQHYQLFIDNYNTLKNTNNQMEHINGTLDTLIDHLPSIGSSCESFSVMSREMTDRRTAVKTLLDNFPTILDLLEVPQLMDTCVKNASYDEALQLESFAKKLAKQYPNIKIVNEIILEVQTISQTLISNLQQSLRGNISLTDAIKTIGILRRLSVYKENELKATLLYSRDQWLMNTIKSIPSDTNNPVTYLTKLTDCCRTNIFDIVTQFNAIFSDDSDDDSNLDDYLLYGWTQQKVLFYIETLEKMLPTIKEGSGISYCLENAMYYSMSMSRVGIDFRSLLVPLFERTIINLVISKTTTATHLFIESLKYYKFQPSSSSKSNNSSPLISPSSSNLSTLIAPNTIQSHQPIALLCNAFISSFIELKECAIISLQHQLSLKLKDILVTIVSGVHSFNSQQQQQSSTIVSPSTTTVITPFQNFCKCIVEDFIPFIVNSYDRIFLNKSGIPIIDVSGLVTSLIKIYNPNPQPPLPLNSPIISPTINSLTTSPTTTSTTNNITNTNTNTTNNNSTTITSPQIIIPNPINEEDKSNNENEKIINNNNETSIIDPIITSPLNQSSDGNVVDTLIQTTTP